MDLVKISSDVLLSGILNHEAKILQAPPAAFWLCCQVTFLAHVKQLGITTVKKSKQEERQMHKKRTSRLTSRKQGKEIGVAIQLQR